MVCLRKGSVAYYANLIFSIDQRAPTRPTIAGVKKIKQVSGCCLTDLFEIQLRGKTAFEETI